MTLRDCLATLFAFKGIDANQYSTKQFIEEGRKLLFDFDYPLYDSSYKGVFETHFIRYFYTKEIGFESESLFKFELETWLQIHMPYFNKLYQSELIVFDPLLNSKEEITRTKTNDRDHTQTSNTTGTNTSESTQNVDGTLSEDQFNRHLKSNTPDSRLAITTEEGQGVIEYASEITEDVDKNGKTSNSTTTGSGTDNTDVTSNATNTINEVEDYVESKVGKIGSQSYSSMLKEYRESLIRVEQMMFKEMRKDLFMLVY